MYKTLPLVLFLLAGCAKPWTPSPVNNSLEVDFKVDEKQTLENNTPQVVKEQKNTGFIKGVIQSIEWDRAQNLWVYEVAGSDTKNGKLPHARFSHNQKLYSPGAFIYAQIKDGSLVEMYKVSGNQLFSAKKSFQQPAKITDSPTQKRTKMRQKIAPPQEQTIQLE